MQPIRTTGSALLALVFAGILTAATAPAAEQEPDAVWTNAEGEVWRDADGECWRNPDLPAQRPRPECGDAPPDADGDGVADDADACPGTPEGVRVDDEGCPLDGDGDGVADHQDECQRTPAGARVDERGCQVMIEETVTRELEVHFAFDSAEVPDEFYPEIRSLAAFMREYPSTATAIAGHTDSIGPAEYNKGLSRRRAEAVVEILVEELSIAADRLEAVGRGEERPVATNDTEAGRAENRRVVATIRATEKRTAP